MASSHARDWVELMNTWIEVLHLMNFYSLAMREENEKTIEVIKVRKA